MAAIIEESAVRTAFRLSSADIVRMEVAIDKNL
jgi:hypothetical protein